MPLFRLISFKQFFRDITRQKMRTTLTVIGIFWGTVSVVLLFSVGKGLEEMMLNNSKGLGDRISIVWPGVTAKSWNGMPAGRRIRYAEDDVLTIKKRSKLISAISVEYRDGSTTFRHKTNTASSSISGVWPEFGEMRSVIPKSGGRFLNKKDLEEKRKVIFLGFAVAEKLFGTDEPIGKKVFVEQTPFLVIGVMQKKNQNSSYSGRDKDKGFIPSTTFMTMKSRRYPSNFVFQSKVDVEMEDAIKEVHSVLAPRHGYDPSDTRALSIWDTTRGSKFWSNFFVVFRSFLVIIGCFTLITGGIGVANIMHVVVQERTKEIGIKIALGAHKSMILMQFLAEGTLLTAIGGSLGFALAYSFITFVPPFLLQAADFDLAEYIGTPNIDAFGTLLTVAILGLTAIFAGYFPAKRASNLQPVEAIKLF
jgi:putative ABC transport system permease protein